MQVPGPRIIATDKEFPVCPDVAGPEFQGTAGFTVFITDDGADVGSLDAGFYKTH